MSTTTQKSILQLPVTPEFSLQGRLALITGSTQGLGWAIASAYAAYGARILINGRSSERVDAAVRLLRERGHAAEGLVLDVADLEGQSASYERVCKQHGTPDILVNNVGVRNRKLLADASAEEIAELIHVDLVAATNLSRLAAGAMVKAGTGGRIISITSIADRLARYGDAIYPIAKHGMVGLVRALAVEYGRYGVTSNGLSPGTFATETNQELVQSPERSRVILGNNPLGRWADPAEICGAAVFLASPSASYVNGHVLVVDGGFSVAF